MDKYWRSCDACSGVYVVLFACCIRLIVFSVINTRFPFVAQDSSGSSEVDAFVSMLESDDTPQSYAKGASAGPCNNFYDSVCNVFDPEEKRSLNAGSFSELAVRNKEHTREVLHSLLFYNVCVEVLGSLNEYNFDEFTETLTSEYTGRTPGDYIRAGLPFPFKLEATKSFTSSNFAIDLDLDFGFYFYAKFSRETYGLESCFGTSALERDIMAAYSSLEADSYPDDMTSLAKCALSVSDLELEHEHLGQFLRDEFGARDETIIQTQCQESFYQRVLKAFEQPLAPDFTECLHRFYLLETLGSYSQPSGNGIVMLRDPIAASLRRMKGLKEGLHDLVFNYEKNENAERCETLTKTIEIAAFNRLYVKKLLDRMEIKGVPTHSNATTNLINEVVRRVRSLLHDSKAFNSDGDKLKALTKMDNLVIRNMITEFDNLETNPFVGDASDWIRLVYSEKAKLAGVRSKIPNDTFANARLDPKNWFTEGYTVPTDIVNAWYDPTKNTITLPVAITLYPIFRNERAMDLSLLGVIVGHELGHMTDVHGVYFDENGNYVAEKCWQLNDTQLELLAMDYGHPCGRADYGVNTLGEDMADQMGVRVMYEAYANYTLSNWNGAQEGVSTKEDFFSSYARLWCGRSSHRRRCYLVSNDVHALAKHRVNKTLRQIGQFAETFNCKSGDKMYRQERVLIY